MAYWLVIFAGELWRRAIEAEAGRLIREAQAEVGGTLMPTWRGYALVLDHARIEWRGSLWGYQTRLVRAEGKLLLDGLRPLSELTRSS
ncbi:MAG: hypothetical protein EP330_09925 [Deltaproteobacteria bacterium]|nr:MAG: hypothetical protein EP330_09925 [Deltaproteobacteria bacterium]